jgi:SPP1 Gp6-like portal protein
VLATDINGARRLVGELAMELRRRRPIMWQHDDYYRGEHRLMFASEQFRKYFGDRYTKFADNWTQVVADAPVERLNISGFRLANEDSGYDKDLWSIWQQNDCDEQSDLAFLEAVITGRSFALVWGDQDDNPLVTFEHPSQCIVAYDMETRQRSAGLKLWTDDEYAYATLYLPDEVWKFQQAQAEPYWQREFRGPYFQPVWEPRESVSPNPVPNPLGCVPLVEFQNRPRLIAEPMSDVKGVIAMQDAINLTWAYLFNAADFASLGQRVVTGAERPKVPILDENGNAVGERDVPLESFAKDRIIWLTDPDAKPTQWDAADLTAFTPVIEMGVDHIAAQTRTPPHYLIGKIANVSADALKAAETGLVKRTMEKTVNFGKGIKEIGRLAALVQGNDAKATAIAGGTVLWRDIESRSDAQLVDSLLKLKQMGMPFEFLCERYGLSPTEIARVIELKQQEAAMDPLSLLANEGVQMTAEVGADGGVVNPGGTAPNAPTADSVPGP